MADHEGLPISKKTTGRGLKASKRNTPFNEERAFRVVDAMRPIAERHQATVAQVALAWLLSRLQVSTVIVGAKTPEQLTDQLGASALPLTTDDLHALAAVSQLPTE